MSGLPDPASLVHGTGLGSRSHLQRVLVSELARLATLGDPAAPRRARLVEPGPFEAALRREARERGGAVIAEFKQASPSLGPFAMGTPLLAQLRAYREGAPLPSRSWRSRPISRARWTTSRPPRS